MKMRYDEVFGSFPDGQVATVVTLRLGPITIWPWTMPVPPDFKIVDNLTLADIAGKDLEVRIENNIHVIERVYMPGPRIGDPGAA